MAIIKRMSGYDEELDDTGKAHTETPASLPKSVLMGKNVEPGDKIILRVDKVLEDEVVVRYASAKEAKPEPAETPPEPPPAAPMESPGYD